MVQTKEDNLNKDIATRLQIYETIGITVPIGGN
jgi:hypothetical protein